MYDSESSKCSGCIWSYDCTSKCVRGYHYDASNAVIDECIEEQRYEFRHDYLEYIEGYYNN